MIKRVMLLLLILLATIINAKAFDFEVDGLLYNVVDSINNYVEVTYNPQMPNSYDFENLVIPERITIDRKIYQVVQIGERAFMGCEKLKSVNLPQNIKSIGNSSFAACINLTSVELPNSIVKLDIFAFAMCEKLESMVLSSNLDSIPDAIFAGCYNLKIVVIPEGVKYIGQKAFFQCHNLESISIPGNVKNLNGCAIFLGCRKLKEFIVRWEKPVNVYPYFTKDIDVKNCTLVVPKGSKPIYKKSDGWKMFENIIEK